MPEYGGVRVIKNVTSISSNEGAVVVDVVGDQSFKASVNGVAELSVTSGGVEVVQGPLTVTAGGLAITAGGLTATAGNITNVAGFYVRTVAAAVTAAGTDLATATALTKEINAVTTVAASTGVSLPVAAVGAMIVVQNLGANDLEVFPPDASGVINGAAAGEAITLAAATDVVGTFYKTATNSWIATVAAGPAT